MADALDAELEEELDKGSPRAAAARAALRQRAKALGVSEEDLRAADRAEQELWIRPGCLVRLRRKPTVRHMIVERELRGGAIELVVMAERPYDPESVRRYRLDDFLAIYEPDGDAIR